MVYQLDKVRFFVRIIVFALYTYLLFGFTMEVVSFKLIQFLKIIGLEISSSVF
ncbi:uncharacterized protein Smp_200220 [Schistosoma mansoni]|uniref:uncharacterized protein n=1 Tax=Schistosoma mansoni TaxID=6183 RepID=UPI00022DC6AD|nr:uncharacterized protein Smp_200220 [Schistosoma mansoni]|eukprot:XP_018649486.1 uncharacterized protein Smp_200220 [Schistosoma mansoni]